MTETKEIIIKIEWEILHMKNKTERMLNYILCWQVILF
jgi:hypothetical protein